jgi:chitodextrinase
MTSVNRPTTRMLFFLVVAMALAVVVPLVVASGDGLAQTEPPQDGDWVVTDDTVITDRHVLLNGNLTVKTTGRLTLENVSLELNNTRPGKLRIIVDKGARLTVRDKDGDPGTTGDASVIQSTRASAQYQWICEEGSVLRISASVIRHAGAGWGLIVATDDALIEDTLIEDGMIGVHVRDGDAVIRDCTIRGHDWVGVLVVNGTAQVDGCNITGNHDIGVMVNSGSGTTYVRNCTISDHGFSGVDVMNGTVTVADCTVTNTSWSGVRFNNGTTGRVLWSHISQVAQYGIQMDGFTRVLVTNSSVHDVGDTGVLIWNATAWVYDCHVWACQRDGVYVYDTPALVRGNLIEDNGQNGIVISDSQLFLVWDNVVRDNGISGIIIGSQGLMPSTGWLDGCEVTGNDRTGIYVGDDAICDLGSVVLMDNGWYGIFCAENASLEWSMEGDTRIVNETLRVRGDIHSRRNAEVRMVNTTLIMEEHHQYGWGSIYVYATSRMWLSEGSMFSVAKDPGDDVTSALVISMSGYVNATDCFFESMVIRVSDGRLDATRCEFQDADSFVSTPHPRALLFLYSCTFTDGVQGVVANDASVAIVDCSFLRMEEAINLTDCNGPGPNIWDTTFFSVDVALVLVGSVNVHVDDCTFTICGDAISARDVVGLILRNATIAKSTSHGILAEGSSVIVYDSSIYECTSGGIVQNGSTLWIEGTSISNNGRVGVWANMTALMMVNTSVTGTQGIGVRNNYHAGTQGQTEFLMRECFLQGSAAYDIRLEGAFRARVYNTNLDPASVRILEEVLLEVLNPWVLEVVVEGRDPVPPSPVTYQLIDQYGKVQGLGEMPEGENVVSESGKAYSMTATETTIHTPYTVTVTVAGREWTGDVELGFALVSRLYVDLELVPVILMPEQVHEGHDVVLDGSTSTAYPFGMSTWQWTLDQGEPVFGSTATFNFPSEGDYMVHLKVFDTVGNNNTTSLRVTVLDSIPEAQIISEVPTEVDEDQVLELEGRYVTFDRVIITEWEFGDGTKTTGTSVSHHWEEAGEYSVTFTVVEDDGSFMEITEVVTVVNVVPQAVIKEVELVVGKRERFDLDGSTSLDTPSDQGSLRYMWDMGGDPFLTGAQAFWRFDEAGEYVINLMVVDDDGAWDRTSMTVTVFNRPPTLGPIPDARINSTDGVWSYKLVVTDPDDDLGNLTISYPEFEGGGGFSSWVERDDDGGWTVYVRPRVSSTGNRADVDVTVRDGDGGENSTSFIIRVYHVEEGWHFGGLLMVIVVTVAILLVMSVGYMRHIRRNVVSSPPDRAPPEEPPTGVDEGPDGGSEDLPEDVPEDGEEGS